MRDLSDRARTTITLATALALGAVTYGGMFDLDLPGVLDAVWQKSGSIVSLLAIVGVFVVYRWWALLPALVPILVGTYVREFTDYVSPWREEFNGPSNAFAFVVLATLGVLLWTAILSVGLLARALWERLSAKRRSQSLSGAA